MGIDRSRLYRFVERFDLRNLVRQPDRAAAPEPNDAAASNSGFDNKARSVLKTSEAAAILGCGPALVRREVNRGNLPGYRVGPRGDIRIPAQAVQQYLSTRAAANGGAVE